MAASTTLSGLFWSLRELALGLLARGHERGDAIAIVSASRAEWVQMDFAIVSASGVTDPVYASYTPAQIASLVNDADARTLVVEDRARPKVVAHVARVLEAKNTEVQSYARIKKFALVPAPLTEATGEMTPTQKMKRQVVAARYAGLLDALCA